MIRGRILAFLKVCKASALADNRASEKSALDRLPQRLQLRPKTQDPQRPNSLRISLQTLGTNPGQIYSQPNPSNAGTKHLGSKVSSPGIQNRVYPRRNPPRESHM